MKALVVGGGIGGLTAALCLHHAGIDVEIHERAAALTEVGAGIQVSPNGMKVLTRLGLAAEIEAIAFRPQSLDMRMGQSGARIFSIPIREQAPARYGAPYLHVHRADIQDVLARALRERVPGNIHLGHELKALAQDGSGVTATFTDGSTASARSTTNSQTPGYGRQVHVHAAPLAAHQNCISYSNPTGACLTLRLVEGLLDVGVRNNHRGHFQWSGAFQVQRHEHRIAGSQRGRPASAQPVRSRARWSRSAR